MRTMGCEKSSFHVKHISGLAMPFTAYSMLGTMPI